MRGEEEGGKAGNRVNKCLALCQAFTISLYLFIHFHPLSFFLLRRVRACFTRLKVYLFDLVCC